MKELIIHSSRERLHSPDYILFVTVFCFILSVSGCSSPDYNTGEFLNDGCAVGMGGNCSQTPAHSFDYKFFTGDLVDPE